MICFVDYRITELEKKILKSLDLSILEIPKCNNLYKAIDGHVDIQLNILDKKSKKVIIHKDISKDFKEKLDFFNINYIESSSSLKNAYPDNIFLNALILEDHFVHNLKYTDKNLFSTQSSKNLINVKQGYTKCSCLPVSDKAFITSDIGIYNALKNHGFDILLLPPGDIILEGLDYGFIGGVGGLINKNLMAFYGSLDLYIYGDKVKSFLKKYGVSPIYLMNEKLHDRGSLLVL
ncbi:hypothetical protein NSA50_01260 [Clostridium sp. DSM 100503]|uniref:DUF6873 family GME fold protein n=1 Tax=Clostridium sp. DSM 100503 TaxID=2963282 RepID=UPI00214A72A7|nr:hypothetical protein [Clostridium sp. DSM 100503]MCR1949683.1 hypothetical protein [Clostridium sp. DSM 100503]